MPFKRAILVLLMKRYVEGLLDPFVSLLELHKLMYFMQEAGDPLELRFVPGPYGPYAENLRQVQHILRTVEDYCVSSDQSNRTLELVFSTAQEAESVLQKLKQQDTLKRFERVSCLIEGFESPYGLELLSTVHWIATREKPATADELVERFYAWDPRKVRFTPRQILLAYRVLSEQGWIQLPATSKGRGVEAHDPN